MMSKKGVVRIFAVAVALGLLIFLALLTPPPSFFDLAPWSIKGLQALYSAGRGLRSLVFGSRTEFEIPEKERIKILAETGERIRLDAENASLRQALGLGHELGQNSIPADIAGFFREARDEFILINRGRTYGLKPGWLVIDKNKILVGVVQDVRDTSSRVKLVTSFSSIIEVVILPPASDEQGGPVLKALARGDNIRELEIDLVPQGAAVGAGDLVFSSPRGDIGSARKFLIGEVREVEAGGNEVFLPVRAVHLFNPFSGETVFVLAPLEVSN